MPAHLSAQQVTDLANYVRGLPTKKSASGGLIRAERLDICVVQSWTKKQQYKLEAWLEQEMGLLEIYRRPRTPPRCFRDWLNPG